MEISKHNFHVVNVNYKDLVHYKPVIKLAVALIFSAVLKCQSQEPSDTLRTIKRWNLHFQNTEILQFHPSFHSLYAGQNSLNPHQESSLSSTSTLFFGFSPWKNAAIYLNPEVSAGKGFSKTLGVAGFPNGEVYRVSNPKPQFTPARYYIRQIFPLSDKNNDQEDDLNQLAVRVPESYLAISAGKFSIMDFFDQNTYSHDPRSQFYNWALMGNGAWDYPADTKGYTYGFVIELVKPGWIIHFSTVMVPSTANGAIFDKDIKHANAEALEIIKRFTLNKLPGELHLLAYFNEARMGSYQKALDWGLSRHAVPVIDSVGIAGNYKYGFGLSLEQQINRHMGLFFRAGWNDGHSETWVFTEIDHAISGGLHFDGQCWNREHDEIGIALIRNGISDLHKRYLQAGGYGFIIGDGYLNYGPEMIMEIYYAIGIKIASLSLSPDYQLIINPAYNKDRGPVHAFGLRAHFEL